jgi:spore maturation protein B
MFLSDSIIPFLVLAVVCCGILGKHNIYAEFIEGAKGGLPTVLGIMPTLIGLMVAVGVLRASGFLDDMAAVFGTIAARVGFPAELMPITFVKMVSSSAATGLLVDLYKQFGTDSVIGRAASIMMSSTETIFYTMSVYLMSAKVTKSRYILPGALLATAAGTIVSVCLAHVM